MCSLSSNLITSSTFSGMRNEPQLCGLLSEKLPQTPPTQTESVASQPVGDENRTRPVCRSIRYSMDTR
jgi:hypothetical protein